jgi:hypothetical protein
LLLLAWPTAGSTKEKTLRERFCLGDSVSAILAVTPQGVIQRRLDTKLSCPAPQIIFIKS